MMQDESWFIIDGKYCILEDNNFSFPDPRYLKGEWGGVVGVGGNLAPDKLLEAYSLGVFPWYSENEPILWWCPDPRAVLFPKNFRVSKSFRRVLKNKEYQVTFDRAFDDVIRWCSKIPRKGQSGTWLNEELINSFKELYRMGFAHSVEVWMDGRLAGGLYGLAIGGAFFGESMFSLRDNASKIALKAISDVLNKSGYDFIDCQVKTSHLLSLGAVEIPKIEFLDRLKKSIKKRPNINWQNLKWEYSDG